MIFRIAYGPKMSPVETLHEEFAVQSKPSIQTFAQDTRILQDTRLSRVPESGRLGVSGLNHPQIHSN